MKNVRKMLLAALVALALGMLTGCGSSGSNSSTPAAVTTATTTATVVAAPAGSPAGSVATVAPVNATTASGVPVLTIPSGTVITPEGGSLPAGPIALKIQTPPVGSTSGLKVPEGMVWAGSNGAVDISIDGVQGFTVPAPGLTINIPGNPCTSDTELVTAVRYDGSFYTVKGTCSNSIVTITGITKFSLKNRGPIKTK